MIPKRTDQNGSYGRNGEKNITKNKFRIKFFCQNAFQHNLMDIYIFPLQIKMENKFDGKFQRIQFSEVTFQFKCLLLLLLLSRAMNRNNWQLRLQESLRSQLLKF